MKKKTIVDKLPESVKNKFRAEGREQVIKGLVELKKKVSKWEEEGSSERHTPDKYWADFGCQVFMYYLMKRRNES